MGDHAPGSRPAPSGEGARVAGVRLREQSVLDQLFEADQQRIARKRGEALIRRVAVAGRAERQHLPQSLARGREQIDERERARAQSPRCRSDPAARSDGAARRSTAWSDIATSEARRPRPGLARAWNCCSITCRAASRPPSPNAIASPSIRAPNVIAKAVSTTAVASPSCSSAITTPMAITSSRSAPLSSRAPGRPAFTDASSVARQRKLPTRKPSASTSSATRKRGTNRKNSCDEPLKRLELQRVDRRHDEADPDQPEDDLARSAPRRAAFRRCAASRWRRSAATGGRSAARRASAGRPGGRASATRKPPAKMMVAATSRGTNSTNALAKLRHD